MTLSKKIKKLQHNPKQFFKDAISKRLPKRPIFSLKKATYESTYKYTIVSAVYGVEKYIDEFIRSVVNQTTSLKKIQLILVDDGSLDLSAQKIKSWCKKYPNNIFYYKKENGGQASARNFGLQYATGDWVTFTDPDDFLNPEYIEEVDKLIHLDGAGKVGLVGCKWRLFFEGNNTYSDNHPLNYRFKSGNRIVDPLKDPSFMVSSPATSFYKMKVLNDFHIRFDERIRPNFEDGHFSGMYLSSLKAELVGYCAKAIYFYRKRSDGSSTLDNSWNHSGRFDEVMRFGYLNLLTQSQDQGKAVPLAIQRLVMYDVFWYIKKIANNESSVSFLSNEQKTKFFNYLCEVFEFIDSNTIMRFELAGIWFYHKVAILGLFKSEDPTYQLVYVEQLDASKNMVQLRYFYHGDETPFEHIFDANTKAIITPVYEKSRLHDFLGHQFVKERLIWIKLEEAQSFSVQIGFLPTRLSLNGKDVNGAGISANQINKSFIEKKSKTSSLGVSDKSVREYSMQDEVKLRYKDAWLLMDRDNQADDNGEHFYRYLLQEQAQVNAFFVLKKDSQDWSRLLEEGFRLVDYGSLEHKALMLNAIHVVTSHPDAFVLNLLPTAQYGDLLKYKYTFLQHGVIRDDISNWLNTKKIDCFVTSSPQEYASIAGGETNYKFGPKEVVMTGLARHDALLARDEPTENVIIFMPTWRQNLVGSTSTSSTKRAKADVFYESEYAKQWKSLLHSDVLRSAVEKYGYKVVFFPHANMQMYLDWFEAPTWVEMRSHSTDPILHKLFRRAKVLVTDYSSVFFEFGIQKKAVLHYQFDFEEMYGAGVHTARLGYFNFEKDGFGPVAYDELSLLEQIEKVLARNGIPDERYLKRMEGALPLRDQKNRKRTYDAIVSLDEGQIEASVIDSTYLLRQVRAAYQNGNMLSSRKLWLELSDVHTLRLTAAELQQYLQTLILADRLEKALQSIEVMFEGGDISSSEQSMILFHLIEWCAKLQLWKTVLDLTCKINQMQLIGLLQSEQKISLVLMLKRASAEIASDRSCGEEIEVFMSEKGLDVASFNLSEEDAAELELTKDAFVALFDRDWSKINTLFKENRKKYQHALVQPLLLRAQIALGLIEPAKKQLSMLSKLSVDSIDWELEGAFLKYKQGIFDEAAKGFKSIFEGQISVMPNHVLFAYFTALLKTGYVGIADEIVDSTPRVKIIYGLLMLSCHQGHQAFQIAEGLSVQSLEMSDENLVLYRYLMFLLAINHENWELAKSIISGSHFSRLTFKQRNELLALGGALELRVLAALGAPQTFDERLKQLTQNSSPQMATETDYHFFGRSVTQREVSIWRLLACNDWQSIASELADVDENGDGGEKEVASLRALTNDEQIILATAYRKLGRLNDALEVLKRYEKHTKNDTPCRIQIAMIELENGWWEKVMSQLRAAYPHGESTMPRHVLEVWNLPVVRALARYS